MRLSGIHHITAITGDAPTNVDFYTGVLGLRMVAKTVNQDDPTVYHLFYASEEGQAGSDMTFFEYPGAIPGRPGAGMIHTIEWRVGSPASIDFWERRIEGSQRVGDRLRFADPEGLAHELVVDDSGDEALTARHPDIPDEHALRGFHGVRAYSDSPEDSGLVLERLMNAERKGDATWELRSDVRGGTIAYEPAPAEPGRQSGGSIHHIAWGTTAAEHPRWAERLNEVGMPHSGIIDRHYFHSIYFREPSGVLFELADDAPGFTVDVPLDKLGEVIILPPRFEPHREQIEARLTPLPDPRAGWPRVTT
jgi:glyoxalase family protein